MDAACYVLLIVLTSSIGLALIGGVGVFALPWTDQEFDETVDAFVALKDLSLGLYMRMHRPPKWVLSLRAPAFRPPISLASSMLYTEEPTAP